MAHKITRNITQVNDIKKLGMNVTNECDLVSDGKNVYVRVGKEYRQIDNEEFQEVDLTDYYNKSEVDEKIEENIDKKSVKTINGKEPNNEGNISIYAATLSISNNNTKGLMTLLNEIDNRIKVLENSESE